MLVNCHPISRQEKQGHLFNSTGSCQTTDMLWIVRKRQKDKEQRRERQLHSEHTKAEEFLKG